MREILLTFYINENKISAFPIVIFKLFLAQRLIQLPKLG